MDSYFKLILFLIFILLNICNTHCECNITYPILIGDECQRTYCTEDNFTSGYCKINNDIIKTQWLNDIITFDFDKLRYGSLAINSNGDMVHECSVEEAKGIRVFYWLKQDGSYYFQNENGEKFPSKTIIVQNGETYPIRYESQIIFVTLDNGSQCLISISLYFGMVEYYDFENNQTSLVSSIEFTNHNIFSTVSVLTEYKNSNETEYYYTFIGQNSSEQSFTYYYIVFQKYTFSKNIISLNDGYTVEDKIKKSSIQHPRVMSSFKTDSNIIILFYLEYNNFQIESYNDNYEYLNSTIIGSLIGSYEDYKEEGIFNKCIYLKDNIGAFIFYTNNTNYIPQFRIIEIKNNGYLFSEKYNTHLECLEGYMYEPLLNDLIKINNKRFTFIASTKGRKMLYVIFFDFYNNDNNIKERTYKIQIFDIYNLRIYRELSTVLYNNYITLSMSVCNTEPCNRLRSESNYFTFLIIFGYVNGTDSYINISQYLTEFNEDNKFNIIDKLLEYAVIDNNLFGYELQKKIKLISIPEELSFYNIENTQKTLVNSNETLNYEYELIQNKNTKRLNKTYYFEFQYIAQEPEMEKFNNYPIEIRTLKSIDNQNEQDEIFESNIFYGKTIKAEFKLCYELCETCEYLGISFSDQRCTTCIENYLFNESNCYPKDNLTDFYSVYTTEYINDSDTEYMGIVNNKSINLNDNNCSSYFVSKDKNECLDICSYEDLLNKICVITSKNNKNTIINNLIKNHIINNYTNNDILTIESDDNYIFQITNTLNEENTKIGILSNIYNLSIIDLGECGEKLKEVNHINKDIPLIIYKLERLDSIASQKNIQYEIYNPETKERLDLSICINKKIHIYIPISLSEETLELHKDLLNYGYDLFNPNDSFYQDICTEYTSPNGTDVILSDRRLYYFNNTETACQEDCEYVGYLEEVQQLKCECNVTQEEIEPEKDYKFNGIIILSSFYDVIKYSNILVIKCYKLVFSYKGQKNNIGSFILIGFFILYSIFNFIYFATGFFYVKLYSAKILFNNNIYRNNKLNDKSIRKENKSKSPIMPMPPRKKIKSKTKYESPSKINIDNLNSEILLKNSELFHDLINKKMINNKKLDKSNNYCTTNKKIKKQNKENKDKQSGITHISIIKGDEINRKTIANSNRILNMIDLNLNNEDKRRNHKKGTININYRYNHVNNYNIYNKNYVNNLNNINSRIQLSNNNTNIGKFKKSRLFFNRNNFYDFELNELPYNKAIKYDKRSFVEYYVQLIKREHLIIFTFFSCNDYNIISVKLSKFIFSIVLDFALNVVFFFDDSMHKIYLDYGKYSIIAQIPQIIYSNVTSESLDVLLRYLCLTEKSIYKIKKLEEKSDTIITKKKIFTIIKRMRFRLVYYFIVTFFFMVFFWYFISAFCAVYKNTQIFLIKDLIISFILSLIYPFILYIFPSALRIISLKDKKKRLKFLYTLSDLIPLI